jgi:hypothetical protein
MLKNSFQKLLISPNQASTCLTILGYIFGSLSIAGLVCLLCLHKKLHLAVTINLIVWTIILFIGQFVVSMINTKYLWKSFCYNEKNAESLHQTLLTLLSDPSLLVVEYSHPPGVSVSGIHFCYRKCIPLNAVRNITDLQELEIKLSTLSNCSGRIVRLKSDMIPRDDVAMHRLVSLYETLVLNAKAEAPDMFFLSKIEAISTLVNS